MSKARTSFAIIGLASALAFTGPTFAQDGAFYVGGAIGQASWKNACDDFSGLPGVSCDDEDTSWKIFGGYRFNRNFALELGYADFGEVEARGPGGTASAEATAFELVAIGMLPLANNFSIYGKVGLYRAETDAAVNTFLIVADESESNTDLTFGIGAQFDVSKQFAIRAEWQRYQDVGGGDIGESDIDVISIGAFFRF